MNYKLRTTIKYAIFKTKWGYFGLAGAENALCRTSLPLADPEKAKLYLLKGLPNAQPDNSFFKITQERIAAYFQGAYVDFEKDIPILLDGLGLFAGSVLTACRDIKFGQTMSYLELAKTISRPAAARAVGSALAKNPLPLIVPCHRVIRTDGKISGFSAPGGAKVKTRLIEHEHHILMGFRGD